jgi:hypothetical protein
MSLIRLVVAVFVALIFAILVLLATGSRRTEGPGVTALVHAPWAELEWGPDNGWTVDRGVAFFWDRPIGPPGTYLEFPITGGRRASLRLWSPRWHREYAGR